MVLNVLEQKLIVQSSLTSKKGHKYYITNLLKDYITSQQKMLVLWYRGTVKSIRPSQYYYKKLASPRMVHYWKFHFKGFYFYKVNTFTRFFCMLLKISGQNNYIGSPANNNNYCDRKYMYTHIIVSDGDTIHHDIVQLH